MTKKYRLYKACATFSFIQLSNYRVEGLIKTLRLPVKAEGCDIDTLYEAIFHDKKTVNGQVKWVLMEDIGRVCITKDVPESIVKAAMLSCID